MLPGKTVTPQTLYRKLLYRLCGVTRKDSNTTDFISQVTIGSVVLPEKTVTPQINQPKYRLFSNGGCHHDDFKIRGHFGNINMYLSKFLLNM